MPLSETDKAYLAGLIDGEGSICIAQRRPKPASREKSTQYAFTVSIAMCDEDLIRWIHQNTSVGNVYKRTPRKANHRPSWQWVTAIREGAMILQEVLPYLRLKKQQAELFIEIAQIRAKGGPTRTQPQRQKQIALQVAQLNKRGVYSHSSL